MEHKIGDRFVSKYAKDIIIEITDIYECYYITKDVNNMTLSRCYMEHEIELYFDKQEKEEEPDWRKDYWKYKEEQDKKYK